MPSWRDAETTGERSDNAVRIIERGIPACNAERQGSRGSHCDLGVMSSIKFKQSTQEYSQKKMQLFHKTGNFVWLLGDKGEVENARILSRRKRSKKEKFRKSVLRLSSSHVEARLNKSPRLGKMAVKRRCFEKKKKGP